MMGEVLFRTVIRAGMKPLPSTTVIYREDSFPPPVCGGGGFTITTDEAGQYRLRLNVGKYNCIGCKDGYVNVGELGAGTGHRFEVRPNMLTVRTIYMAELPPDDPKPLWPVPEPPDLDALMALITWQNLLKTGAVIILVGAGSKAFKEFKETFKK